jgi:hypothetical protein
MEKKKTFKELFAGTGIEPTTNENGGVDYNFNATLKKYPLTGSGTLSQTFMPTYSYSNETIKMSSHDFLPNTSIFATVDGEITDIINIKDSFRFLPNEEKLKIVSILLEFCAAETSKLTSQNI